MQMGKIMVTPYNTTIQVATLLRGSSPEVQICLLSPMDPTTTTIRSLSKLEKEVLESLLPYSVSENK